MFQHILLPVDFSETGAAAVELAREMALASGSRVTLLHVIELIEGAGDEETAELYQLLESRAQAELDRLRDDLAIAGVDAETTIVFGKRSPEIVRCAEQAGIDLVVMSSRRLDPQSPPQQWPTISHQVAVFAGCPVLLVR